MLLKLLKPINSLLIVLTLSFLSFSCAEKYEEHSLRVFKVIKNNEPASQIIVIPGEGCGGCISSATYFVTQNYERLKENTFIIFTGVQDTKLLKNQLGNDFLLQKNVYVDENNLFMNKEVLSSYPYIIYMSPKNYKIESIINFSEEYVLIRDGF